MNIYTRNLSTENLGAGGPAAGSRFRIAGIAARICFLILLIFGAIAGQVHLRAEIERLNKEATKIRKEINELNVLYTNIRNKREELTGWKNVQAKIKHYRLGLRSREYRQVSKLDVAPVRPVRRALQTVRSDDEVTPMPRRRELAGNSR